MSKKVWYCTGTWTTGKTEKEDTFCYRPKLVNSDSTGLFHSDWIFDEFNKNKCKEKCDQLNSEISKRKQHWGIISDREYFFSRYHEIDSMLTVKDLISYLQKQDPDALVVAYEPNSYAYISQDKELPNDCIQTVKDDKIKERESLEIFYKNLDDKERQEKVENDMKEQYRYVRE